MPEKAYLVVDVGTGGAKCAVFDAGGGRAYVGLAELEFKFEDGGMAFEPRVVWGRICSLIRSGLKVCAGRGLKVVAVSSTSMREGNVFYDREGRELLATPNIDSRAAEEAKEIPVEVAEEIYRRSGHWPSAIFLVNRLRWLKKRRSALYARVARVSMINDWVLYKLTGRLFSEPTNGCETAAFSLARRSWSEETMKELRLSYDMLPEIRECGDPIGCVTGAAVGATGLDASTTVVVGAADTEAAVLGCGVSDEGLPVAVAGTTTPVQAVTSVLREDERMRTWTCCHPVPGRWVLESNAGATGLVFGWWAKLVGRDYDELDREAAMEPPKGRTGVQARIGTSLMNSRRMHPLVGQLRGLGAWTPRGSITRAILEDSCYAVRGNLEQLEEVLDTRFPRLVFCGGCAKSELWSQLQADIAARTTVRFSLGDATSRGAAMLCAVAEGDQRSLEAASRAFGQGRMVLRPRRGPEAVYEESYAAWLSEQRGE